MNSVRTLNSPQASCVSSACLALSSPKTSQSALQAINNVGEKTSTIHSLTGCFFQALKDNPTITGLTLISLSILAVRALYKSTAHSRKLSVLENPSLESEMAQTKLDINQVVNFVDYRYPNESNIIKNQHLFRMQEPGLLVSTGTERSFFGLIETVLASPEGYCQGLVIRDINPKVKAYTDFNVLLLRLANDVTEYKMLSGDYEPVTQQLFEKDKSPQKNKNTAKTKIHNRIKVIKSKLESDSSIPLDIKQYYLENLDVLATSYYEIDSDWRDPSTSTITEFPRYFEDPNYFAILQQYAKSGNIISTVGDIGDLEFLARRNISIVDVSNIADYSLIYFRSNNPYFKPKIISTQLNYTSNNPRKSEETLHVPSHKKNENTRYIASEYKPISKDQKEELDDLLNFLETCRKNKKHQFIHLSLRPSLFPISAEIKGSIRKKVPFAYYSEELLIELKQSIGTAINNEEPRDSSFGSKFGLLNLTQSQKKEWNDIIKKYLKNQP